MISKYAIALAVVGALLAPLSGIAQDKKSTAKQWVKDSKITASIKKEYAKDKQVSMLRIRVNTDASGMVQLSGNARSEAEKMKAEEIAKGVQGVASVDNQIKIVPKKQKS
jgi:hyperosmotically inducible protein